MQHSQTQILSLKVDVPSRWVLGEARLVKLRLTNLTQADLSHVHIRPVWSGAEKVDDLWRKIGTLRRGASIDVAQHMSAPPGREDQFQVEVQTEVGPFLRLELWSAKVDATAQSRPGGDVAPYVVIKDSGIHGERQGTGQVVMEGSSGIGHVFNVHGGSSVREFEQWLSEDEGRNQMRELPLYIAQEICHPWTSHCGIDLCGISHGSFVMGANPADAEAEPEERIRREVSLTKGFWMGRFPVTQAEYAHVMTTPCAITLDGHKGPRMPAACVTWGEAMAFCEELTRIEREAGALPPGYAYRLPTEAQWEYSCRARTLGPHHGPLEKIAAVKKNAGGMGDVGRFEPNALGLHDMLGLVFEWCLDAYAPYRSLELTDPCRLEPERGQPLTRVVRGGCYQGPDVFARASARWGRDPSESSHRIGFRVVLARE